jgi:excisionase family DNA binding protein
LSAKALTARAKYRAPLEATNGLPRAPECEIRASENLASTPTAGFLSLEQAAAYLGVSPHTVRAWRKQGIFPSAMKFGRLPRWSVGDLNTWAESRREIPGGATIALGKDAPCLAGRRRAFE